MQSHPVYRSDEVFYQNFLTYGTALSDFANYWPLSLSPNGDSGE
jgi:hypothetical protein